MKQKSPTIRMGFQKRLILFVAVITTLCICMGSISVFQILRIKEKTRLVLQEKASPEHLLTVLTQSSRSAVSTLVMTVVLILILSFLILRSLFLPLSRIILALKTSLQAAESGDRAALRQSAAIAEELMILLDIRPEQPSK